MRHKTDRHPHHAGHRHAGIKVGENAKRSGPQPGQTEFSADQEKAMRASGPSSMGGGAAPMPNDNDADDMPSAAPAAAPGGAPMSGQRVPADLDSDGGM